MQKEKLRVKLSFSTKSNIRKKIKFKNIKGIAGTIHIGTLYSFIFILSVEMLKTTFIIQGVPINMGDTNTK